MQKYVNFCKAIILTTMKRLVLIIDDEVDICYLLSKILKQKNFHVVNVNTILDAAVALEKMNPDIIFLDNHLPDGLGMNFVGHIKKNHPRARVIMISAHDTCSDNKKARENGVDHFIGKPFDKNIICSIVDESSNIRMWCRT